MEDDELVVKNDWYPWTPMSKPIDVKHLGKLGEELNEAGAVVSRCLIQGIDECEPVTGKLNRKKLEDEISDVEANIELVKEHFKLDIKRMGLRKRKKKALLKKWHNALGDQRDIQNIINKAPQEISTNKFSYIPVFSLTGIGLILFFILFMSYRYHS